MAWYEKNMLSKNLMSNVNQNANKNESLGEDPIMLDEFDDCCLIQWFGKLKGKNGDANLNMPLFDNFIQVFDVLPHAIHALTIPSQHTPMQSMGFHGSVPPQ
jgi:hypothetical protein